MPTTKDNSTTRDNDDSALNTMNGPSEVIEVSDNEPIESESTDAVGVGGTVDLTDNVDNVSTTSTIPARHSDKENTSDDSKMDDAKDEKTPKLCGRERTGLRKVKEDRETEKEVEQEEEEADAKSNEECDENSDDNGMGIAITRAKRSSVRRPVRHGDFDFDYGDSSEYEDEDEEDEEVSANAVSDGTRSRENRPRMERHRVNRAYSNSSVADDGELEEDMTKGKFDRSRKNRKRTSHIEGQASLKKRRKNQSSHNQYLDDETPSNGLEDEMHLNSSQAADSDFNASADAPIEVGEHGDPPLRESVVAADGEPLSEGDPGAGEDNIRGQRVSSGQTPPGDDSDLFCWVCHKYGKVICCETCVRVYHMRCLNLNSEPSDDWFCPECADIMVDAQRAMDPVNDDDPSTSARLPINKHELAPLLLHAIEMMRAVSSSQPFHEPVDTNDIKDYGSYIVNPMSLSKLEENVQALKYSSTGGFMSDARWIMHNCIVYNGANNPLTAISRQILKRCRIEMREILACPDCYKYQAEASNDNCGADDETEFWFSKVCRIPHPIVWVRLRNYPVWPAKVIEEVQVRDEHRVRTKFFGAHDYAEVPFSCATFHTRVRPPHDSRALQVEHFKLALDELQEHERILNLRFHDFALPATAHTYIPEIANNFYRLLGSRQKRLVSATIRAEGSTTSSSSHGTDNGPVLSSGLVSSRRSSNESVSSSVFAGGASVHLYRAKPISDTKTRLVSVPISGTTNANNGTANAGEAQASTAVDSTPSSSSPMETESEKLEEVAAVGTANKKKNNGKEEAALLTEECSDNGHKDSKIPAGSTLAQTIRSAGRRLGVQEKTCNGATAPEEEETLMETEENSVPTATSRPPVNTAEKGTFTEDLDDIMTGLCATDVVDRDVLSLSARDLLSCLRWSCQGGGRSSLLRNSAAASTSAIPTRSDGDATTSSASVDDRQRLEKLANRTTEETSRLHQENGQLRRCVAALEEQLDIIKNKHTRDLKMTEERLALFYELKLLEQRHNFDLSLAETRHSYDNDRVKVVHETRRLIHEDVKKIVSEVKGKQWCAYCRNEAFYYCCWNTSYCDANCQKKHWTTHMTSCAQTNQQNNDPARNQVGRAPNPQQAALNAQHPNQANMAAQIIPGRRMMANMPQMNQR